MRYCHSLENLPVEAKTQGNRKFDREDKSNVIPYIIQEVKEGGRTFVLGISNRYAGPGRGMYEMKLKMRPKAINKLIEGLEKAGADVEIHTGTAVFDTTGYLNWIQTVLDANGLRLGTGGRREILYPYKSNRDGAILREEERDLNQDWSKAGSAGYVRTENEHAFDSSTRGDKKRSILSFKFNTGKVERPLNMTRQYVEHKKNADLFGNLVKNAINKEKRSLKFECDIRNFYGIDIDSVINIRVNEQNKQVRVVSVNAGSPTAKYADIILEDADGDVTILQYNEFQYRLCAKHEVRRRSFQSSPFSCNPCSSS